MAVSSNLESLSVVIKLNNGVSDGKVKTKSVNLGKLNIDRYEDQNAMNICNLLAGCFDSEIYGIQKVAISGLTND